MQNDPAESAPTERLIIRYVTASFFVLIIFF